MVPGGVALGVALAGAVASVNAFTPPWPRHAPLRLVPLKLVPSLQVAVTGLWVCATTAALSPAPKARVKRKIFTLSTSNRAPIVRRFVSGPAPPIGSRPTTARRGGSHRLRNACPHAPACFSAVSRTFVNPITGFLRAYDEAFAIADEPGLPLCSPTTVTPGVARCSIPPRFMPVATSEQTARHGYRSYPEAGSSL